MLMAPRNVALATGSALGAIVWMFLRIERKRLKIAIGNLQNLYPSAPETELRQIIKRVCRHFGRLLTDCARLPLLKRASFEGRIKFEGLDHFIKAYSRGRGVVIATAHFGHFEVGLAALAVMGYPIWYILRTVDILELDKFFDDTRRKTGMGIIKKENAAREIIRKLRAGDVVALHIDQHSSGNSMFIPFLGKWAATITTPAVMGMRTGAPVLSMLCFRDDDTDSFTIRISPEIKAVPTEDMLADVRQITRRLNEILEKAVREAPEQWFWLHNRWKSEPTAVELEHMAKLDDLIRKTSESGQGADAA